MALRLIEVFLPTEQAAKVEDVVRAGPACECLGSWGQPLSERLTLVKLLVDADQTEPVLDVLDRHFSSAEEFRVVVLPVEAPAHAHPATEEPGPEEYPGQSRRSPSG